eukprot:g740.t1
MSRDLDARIYVNSIAVAIDHQNSETLSRALDCRTLFSRAGSAPQRAPDGLLTTIHDYLERLKIESELFASWKQFVFCEYHGRIAILNGSFSEGHQWLLQGLNEWLNIFDTGANSWLIPTMKTLTFTLVDLAFLADNENAESDPNRHCSNTGSALQSAFALICRGSKRSSGLAVSNALYKLYFKLDEVHMAAVFQTRVDSQLSLPFEEFPVSDRATWKYFNGLIALERFKFRDAEECLSYALEHQNKSATCNIRKIMILLIPLRLMFNERPKMETLERFGLAFFAPLVSAVSRGDIGEFRSFMEIHEVSLTALRIWPIVQKLSMVIYRNILQRCYKYQTHQELGPQAHHMDLGIFEAGLRISGLDSITIDDATSLARTLIQKDYVCGYIATKRRLLVLSKNEPFPRLRNVNPETGEIFVELD